MPEIREEKSDYLKLIRGNSNLLQLRLRVQLSYALSEHSTYVTLKQKITAAEDHTK